MKERVFTVLNDSKIICAVWDDVKKPVGVIQIIHGIYDNIKTYNRFARFMNKNGYIVFGTSRALDSRETDCPRTFDKSVKLQIKIMNFLSNQYKLPVFLFGYGYGGFITQSILQKSDIPAAGVCLAGTGKYPTIILQIATLFAWVCTKLFGANAPATILNRISMGAHRARNGIKCTNGFYLELFRGLRTIKPDPAFDTPILMISGANDTHSANAQFSRALYDAYRDNGIMRVSLIIYPDTCDNLLLEMNYGSMLKDIVDFFNRAKSRQ